MSGQNTLITLADDAEVKRPGGVGVSRQFYRDRAVQGAGTYKAMDEDGNIEIIGGPGTGSQLSVQVTYNAGTRTLTATPAGGTVGANSYVWRFASESVGEAEQTFAAPSTTNTIVVAAPVATANGLAEVRVTDSLGRIAYGTFFLRDVIIVP